MSKRVIVSLMAVGAILLTGAGCSKTSPANAPTPLPDTPAPAQTEQNAGVQVEVTLPETPSPAAAQTTPEPKKPAPTPAPSVPVTKQPEPKPTPSPEPTPIPTPTPAVKTFVVTANNFVYDVKTMNVRQGDKVRIVFKNAEGFHDWKIDEFNAATKKIGAGTEEAIEFTAEKIGSFEYYCSVGSHRAMGMKGTLVVE